MTIIPIFNLLTVNLRLISIYQCSSLHISLANFPMLPLGQSHCTCQARFRRNVLDRRILTHRNIYSMYVLFCWNPEMKVDTSRRLSTVRLQDVFICTTFADFFLYMSSIKPTAAVPVLHYDTNSIETSESSLRK